MIHGPIITERGPLVDRDYRHYGERLISPFLAERVQPASYEVTLGDQLLLPRRDAVVDLRRGAPAKHMDLVQIPEQGYALQPHECVLAGTVERVQCPPSMLGTVDGKSTIGRCFVTVHVTAGFIDPGFAGVVTLEIVNLGPWTFMLHAGMKIGQLRFVMLEQSAEVPYGDPRLGSHYYGADGVQGGAAFAMISSDDRSP